ncbi:DUF4913 domain-containing protein [Streptomyces sp. NPDC006925]|uniref:DUF4913 domain-containing protein n=1 Tax=Streptomyces sp. NPDC006925 TaxID=3364768 RepID=UPI0036BF235B
MTTAAGERTMIEPEPEENSGTEEGAPSAPQPEFILYLGGHDYEDALLQLVEWTHNVLLPVYGRETTSTALWCSRWWEHPEAVAQLHGLWLAWAELSNPARDMTGPAAWHRDFLGPVMATLRDPMGPFAGCKPGNHRPKEAPKVESPFVAAGA